MPTISPATFENAIETERQIAVIDMLLANQADHKTWCLTLNVHWDVEEDFLDTLRTDSLTSANGHLQAALQSLRATLVTHLAGAVA